MDRGVDRAGEKRGVDLLRERAVAAGPGERPVLDPVAAGADHLKRDPLDLPALRLRQQSAGLVRLLERERRTARAEREQDGRGHRGVLSIDDSAFPEIFPGLAGSTSAGALAEGVRFELTVDLRPRRFSRPLP